MTVLEETARCSPGHDARAGTFILLRFPTPNASNACPLCEVTWWCEGVMLAITSAVLVLRGPAPRSQVLNWDLEL
jgi:hypothetical protein